MSLNVLMFLQNIMLFTASKKSFAISADSEALTLHEKL